MTTTLRRSPAFVAIDGGHSLFLRDWGEGSPILLLAGWGLDSRIWADTMCRLNASGYRTLAYDRRGHGHSSDPGLVSYAALADDLVRVIECLTDEKLTVVAHSGAVGEALLAADQLELGRIAHLICVGAAGPRILARSEGEPGIPVAMFETMLAQMEGDLCGFVAANEPAFAPGADPAALEQVKQMLLATSRRILFDFQRVIGEADLTDAARNFSNPVTLLHGSADASAPLNLTARAYRALFPDARLTIYEEAGHGLMLSHPDRLAEDIALAAASVRAMQ